MPPLIVTAMCGGAVAQLPQGPTPLEDRVARSLQQDAAPIDAASIQSAVDRLLAFQIPNMTAPVLTGVNAAGGKLRSTQNPVGWVHGALLIGLKDWAQITGDQAWWTWLAVRFAGLHSY